jgi:hypothetical protein
MASPRHYKQQLVDAGFQNVVQVDYKWPTNPWPKDPRYNEIGEFVSSIVFRWTAWLKKNNTQVPGTS